MIQFIKSVDANEYVQEMVLKVNSCSYLVKYMINWLFGYTQNQKVLTLNNFLDFLFFVTSVSPQLSLTDWSWYFVQWVIEAQGL